MAEVQPSTDDILMNPLRGEVFRLSSYISSGITSGRQRGSMSSASSVSKILVGPPPESAAVSGPHNAFSIVVVSNLNHNMTDSQLKKECIESVGRPKYIYMHVADPRTGIFSGTAVIEFSDEATAQKACRHMIASCSTRLVNQAEFTSLTAGEWPMLEYGPPQGVFGTSPAAPASVEPSQPTPSWAQQNRPAPSNPWKK